jgi:DNA-binding NtrC family response regulator
MGEVMNNFQTSKSKLLETIKSLRQTEKTEEPTQADIVIYGVECPFIEGIVEHLKKHFALKAFGSHELAITYCFDNPVRVVILDMDIPTDWKMATDVFTNVRTMKPDIQFILMTTHPQSIPVLTLAAQSAKVLKKPFVFETLLSEIKTAAQ